MRRSENRTAVTVFKLNTSNRFSRGGFVLRISFRWCKTEQIGAFWSKLEHPAHACRPAPVGSFCQRALLTSVAWARRPSHEKTKASTYKPRCCAPGARGAQQNSGTCV